MSEFFSVNDDHLYRIPIQWRSRSSFQVDIFIEDLKTVVEYDGAYYHSLEDARARDIEKTNLLLSHGYRLIRVREFSSRYPYNPLDISDKRFLQLPYEYPETGSHDLESIIRTIVDWITDA